MHQQYLAFEALGLTFECFVEICIPVVFSQARDKVVLKPAVGQLEGEEDVRLNE